MAEQRFDVVVLGGGAAGCVLAARLSEDADRSVCLVEAGPDYGSLAGGGWPADLLDPNQLPVSHDWHYDDGLGWSARVIGGCSTHNACMLTWGAGTDYERWGEGWSPDVLRPYRLRAEQPIGSGRPRMPPRSSTETARCTAWRASTSSMRRSSPPPRGRKPT